MLKEDRLKSFDDITKWPDELTQIKEDLVDAGFFYCGESYYKELLKYWDNHILSMLNCDYRT